MNRTPGRSRIGLPDILLGICGFGFLFLLLEQTVWLSIGRIPTLVEVTTLAGGLVLSLLAFLFLRWFWIIFALMVMLTLGSAVRTPSIFSETGLMLLTLLVMGIWWRASSR